MDQITYMPEEDSTSVDRFTYSGNRFPWWMLVIWVCFILSSTAYLITFMLPNLSRWVDKPPFDKFVP
ncbi:MAG TPA: hypothetical protein VFO76_01490 [Candidatus Kapabacteria bacterium]|nr:hypothetical protein [Candidatus Kapabacteria bacterium]